LKNYYEKHKEAKAQYSKEYYQRNKGNLDYKNKRKNVNKIIEIKQTPILLYF
jgi:hypothetical protein